MSEVFVSGKQYLDSAIRNRDSRYWHQWAMRALFLLGGAHFLAGVVFFFAYNWDDLGPFARFAILQLAILGSFIAALLFRIDRPAGQAMLIAASVFTGVLLAVIGQVYQTGADAWEIFAAWTVLILPWALASRSAAHWFSWIVICLTAMSLYGEQVEVALGHINRYQLAAVIGLVPAVFLAIREFALSRGANWLDGNWFRRGLVLISMTTLFIPAISWVLDSVGAFIGFATFVALSLAIAMIYAKFIPDFSIIAILTAFWTLMAMTIGGRLIHETVDLGDSAGSLVVGLFLLGGWCVLLTGGAMRFLNGLHKRMSQAGDFDE